MVRYFLRIGYIGTKYRGTQKIQEYPENDTIQGAVECALSTLEPDNCPRTCFASRTDKGVHALMNTLHVDLDHKIPGEVYQPNYIKWKLNTYFAENNHEIILATASIVPPTFHARFYARKRSYYYRLAILKPEIQDTSTQSCIEYLPVSEVNRCHLVLSDLNTSTVKHVADMYCGEHDFTTFTKYLTREPWRNPVKYIDECKFYELPHYNSIDDPQYSNISMWEFYIKSKSFLYHQVRKLVGTALSAGFGLLPMSYVQSMLEKPNPRKWIKSSLPPSGGLYLANIEYDKNDFIDNNSSDFERKKCSMIMK